MSRVDSWLASVDQRDVRGFYAALGLELRDRGGDEAPVRCFANPGGHNRGDRDASCSINLQTGVWHCLGCGEKGNAYRAAVILGQTERQAAELAKQYGLFFEAQKGEKPPKPRMPTERVVTKWRRAMRDAKNVQKRLQELKGWTPEGIQRLGLGWDGERVVFVIRNARAKIIGIVRYVPGGKPKTVALPGSKRDLFPPPERIPQRFPIYVVEGEGDCCRYLVFGVEGCCGAGHGLVAPRVGVEIDGPACCGSHRC